MMGGTITPVDGMDAARTMLGFGTWRAGHCLEAVWSAYRANGAVDLTGQREPTALAAWEHTDAADRRTGTPYADIPAGVPVYFGKKASSAAGDVVISVGNGMCVATDIPGRPGVIGKMSLTARQAQIGRPYLGWSTTILDYPIAFTDPAAKPAPDTTNTEPQEDTMAYRAKSKQTGNWYVIYEFTAEVIPAGKNGSKNHTHALAYTKSAGSNFPVLESSSIQQMLRDARDRAAQFNTALAAKIDKLIDAEVTASR